MIQNKSKYSWDYFENTSSLHLKLIAPKCKSFMKRNMTGQGISIVIKTNEPL